jgi:hypothetical protein
LPFAAQVFEPALSLRRKRVINPRAAVDLFAPRLEGAGLFERMQNWVDDAFAEADGFARDETHGFDDLIAVHLAAREQPQHQQLRHTAHEWGVRLRHESLAESHDRPNAILRQPH